MKVFISAFICLFSTHAFSTTPDIGGVKEVIDEAAVVAKVEIMKATEDTKCNPRRQNRYEAKVKKLYKLFGLLDEQISFCTNVDMDNGKQYVVALFCEDAVPSGRTFSATVDSVFYEDPDKKFRRHLSSEMMGLLPMDADPRLEALGFDELLSGGAIEKSETSSCYINNGS